MNISVVDCPMPENTGAETAQLETAVEAAVREESGLPEPTELLALQSLQWALKKLGFDKPTPALVGRSVEAKMLLAIAANALAIIRTIICTVSSPPASRAKMLEASNVIEAGIILQIENKNENRIQERNLR